eukprot:6972536-Pyramimonas_sp.AAC.1
MACFLCNLTSIMWHSTVPQAVPTAKHFSYLDDRFVLVASWNELARVLEATQRVDLATGPDLNLPKCARGVVFPVGRSAPKCAEQSLRDIPLCKHF